METGQLGLESAHNAANDLKFLPSYINSCADDFQYGNHNDTVYGRLNDIEITRADHPGTVNIRSQLTFNHLTFHRSGNTGAFVLTLATCFNTTSCRSHPECSPAITEGRKSAAWRLIRRRANYASYQIGAGGNDTIELSLYGGPVVITAVMFDGVSPQNYPTFLPAARSSARRWPLQRRAPWLLFEIQGGVADELIPVLATAGTATRE